MPMDIILDIEIPSLYDRIMRPMVYIESLIHFVPSYFYRHTSPMYVINPEDMIDPPQVTDPQQLLMNSNYMINLQYMSPNYDPEHDLPAILPFQPLTPMICIMQIRVNRQRLNFVLRMLAVIFIIYTCITFIILLV